MLSTALHIHAHNVLYLFSYLDNEHNLVGYSIDWSILYRLPPLTALFTPQLSIACSFLGTSTFLSNILEQYCISCLSLLYSPSTFYPHTPIFCWQLPYPYIPLCVVCWSGLAIWGHMAESRAYFAPSPSNLCMRIVTPRPRGLTMLGSISVLVPFLFFASTCLFLSSCIFYFTCCTVSSTLFVVLYLLLYLFYNFCVHL